jgi:hypothetical protein
LRNDRRGYQDLDGAAFQLVKVYVGRILKCEKVIDLPVHQSTKVALTLRTRTPNHTMIATTVTHNVSYPEGNLSGDTTKPSHDRTLNQITHPASGGYQRRNPA